MQRPWRPMRPTFIALSAIVLIVASGIPISAAIRSPSSANVPAAASSGPEGAKPFKKPVKERKEKRAKERQVGGWKRVGEGHPGWSQEKWDRWQAKLAEKKARRN
jgi:hypothetical protein